MEKNLVYRASEDKERLDFLYSPLPRSKDVNPKNWISKISFWKTEIRKICKQRMELSFSTEKLSDIFTNEEKRPPACLNEVMKDLYDSREIIFRDDISNILNNTWSYWAINNASKVGSWVWRRYWSGVFHPQTVFVLYDLLEEFSISLLECHYKRIKHEKTDNIVPWNVLKSLYKINDKILKEEDLICVVGYLQNCGKCTVGLTNENEKIVKFKSKSQQHVDAISLNDLETVKIKKSIARLSIESKQLENDIQRLQGQVQSLVRKQDKNQAKKLLIQKQKLQKTLTLKQDAVFSMKEHLRTIQEADTNKLITDAFNSSATLIQNTYREKGLTVDRIDDIFDKTRDANDMVNEVNDAMTAGMKLLEDDKFDMDELEKELENLNEEELGVDEEEAVNNLSYNLPNVPESSPVKAASPEKKSNEVTCDSLKKTKVKATALLS